jgi:type IV pilus assembly protein PilB
MEARPRIGELIGRLVALSGHDVEEILHEQKVTQRRFGEIALSWGLCQPEHVWSAWCHQVKETDAEPVDLDRDGIDAQAVALLPADVAHVFRAVPIRLGDGEVVIASAEPLGERTRAVLHKLLKKKLKFVTAPKRQIDAAIEAYYLAPS